VPKIRRVSGFELHEFTRGRVHKTKSNGMQPLAFQIELGCEYRVGPVHQIAHAGMPNGCHMNADLMGTAGLQLDLEQSCRDECPSVE